jgi:hypothetical protein
MQELHEKYGERGLRVVAVNVQEEIKLVRRFFTDLGISFPVLHDEFGAYATFWEIDVIPTVLLVSIEGEEVFRQVGYDENRLAILEDEILGRLTEE